MIKTYYQMTKPGIIYGNLLTVAAGFFLASSRVGHINIWLLFATMLGVSFVIGAACVFNNFIDRDIDKLMTRTEKRALASGSVSGASALGFASVLGFAGMLLLGKFTNWLTVSVGVVAFIDYVVLYGWSKRHSIYGTIVGSVAGAAPIVAGYTAVTSHIDAGAILLFLIMLTWQMPHFYAIAIFRLDDYSNALIPVLPAVKGIQTTKIQIICYVIAFTIANALLVLFGYTGYIYLGVMSIVGLTWLFVGLVGIKLTGPAATAWARKMFFFSLIVVLVFSISVSLGGWLV
ncbi:MAG: heme o synthase [Candidatus Saccharimonadia bacterium]